MNGGILFIVGILTLLVATWGRFVANAHTGFTLPLLVGGLGALALALYQRWWVKNVFR